MKTLNLNKLLTSIVLFLALFLGISSPVGANEKFSDSPDAQDWGVVTPDENVFHTKKIRAVVFDLQELDGKMYVGGKFLEVIAPDGSKYSQPYLAAFDLETGEWDSAFAPEMDGAVYSLGIAPDGDLLLGGELTGGLAKVDPTTGAQDSNFKPDIRNSWGRPAIFDLEVVGNSVYAGGTFTKSQNNALERLGKFDATTGVIDPSWKPTTQRDTETPRGGGQLVYGLAVDSVRDRVYIVGKFGSINNNSEAAYFATVSPEDGSLIPDVPQGLPSETLNHRGGWSMWQHDVQFSGDHVFVGGQGHQTLILDAETLLPEKSFFTNKGVGDRWSGGDTQVIHVGKNAIWSGCHCWGSVGPYELGSYNAEPGGHQTIDEYRQFVKDFNTIDPFGQQKVKGFYGVDLETHELIPTTFTLSGSAGAWAMYEDSLGTLWVGGQFAQDTSTGKEIYGITKFSVDTSEEPPSLPEAPQEFRSTLQTRERIVLTWKKEREAESYKIFVDGVELVEQSKNWFTHRGLEKGTSYSYQIMALYADGTVSDRSEPLVVETKQ